MNPIFSKLSNLTKYRLTAKKCFCAEQSFLSVLQAVCANSFMNLGCGVLPMNVSASIFEVSEVTGTYFTHKEQLLLSVLPPFRNVRPMPGVIAYNPKHYRDTEV